MGAEDVPQCQHLKVNGERCGSPALRRRRRCYFHEEVRIDRAKAAGDHFAQRRFQLPVLEDANAVQVGLMKVIEMLGYGRMEPRVAGLILYALQTVSYNLRYTNLEPGTGPKVAIDSQRNRRDGSGTRAPHWLMRDSVDALQESVQEPARDDAPEYDAIEAESREKVNNDQVAAGSRKVAAEVAADPAAMARRANREKVRRGRGPPAELCPRHDGRGREPASGLKAGMQQIQAARWRASERGGDLGKKPRHQVLGTRY